ncbi:glycoside hydrolase family 27 protein [Sphingomonas sp. Root241]|uniref:glycoside hydrolase family 27 protein n=1 Tax=Sphingomonas sp. Root241 TaxID=1736501 RepID=UPI0006FE08F0|nr:glycoside hydrolase family 27 protein [Sphingomonas sp. Root241]KRC78399.1 glycoside hydrolase family 27 [Sphingomonas sp. Root241]
MRHLLTALALTTSLTSGAALAQTRFDGVWLFDHAGPNPGVTMLQVASDGARITGAVTTKWYGPVTMQNARLDKGVLTFDVRNLNDREHPTRTWTVKQTPKGVRLVGQMWFSKIDAAGRRGTVKQAEARAFRFQTLPDWRVVEQVPLAPRPPMGWSSWNKFAEKIDDKTIRAMADAMVSTGLRDAGYVYVNIDDGWQGTRGADGRIRPNANFPDMKKLADYVHSKGLKLGIYSSQGPRTCAGFEGSYGHVRQDAQTFADWGIDYLKYDLCSGEYFYADADTVKRSYAEMGAALKATGRPIVYSLCEYGRFDVGAWGRQVGGHLWRTTGDITDDYPTMARIGFDRNGKPEHTGPNGFNDPDMLEVGNGGMSLDEYTTHMTLWAISAAPLLMGHDLRRTPPEMLALLENREVIAVDQDEKGIQGRAVRKDGALEIWAKPLGDGAVALALFNRGDAAARMEARAADAGFATLTAARDLWRGKPVATDALTFDVPAHGAVMLRVQGE